MKLIGDFPWIYISRSCSPSLFLLFFSISWAASICFYNMGLCLLLYQYSFAALGSISICTQKSNLTLSLEWYKQITVCIDSLVLTVRLDSNRRCIEYRSPLLLHLFLSFHCTLKVNTFNKNCLHLSPVDSSPRNIELWVSGKRTQSRQDVLLCALSEPNRNIEHNAKQ